VNLLDDPLADKGGSILSWQSGNILGFEGAIGFQIYTDYCREVREEANDFQSYFSRLARSSFLGGETTQY
jgi:hypothetical protein